MADMNTLSDLMSQLLQIRQQQSQQQQTSNVRPNPKAIQCKTFSIGQVWSNFIPHFEQCVKAQYGFQLPQDRRDFEEAC